jgi:hypothetical protein
VAFRLKVLCWNVYSVIISTQLDDPPTQVITKHRKCYFYYIIFRSIMYHIINEDLNLRGISSLSGKCFYISLIFSRLIFVFEKLYRHT